MSESSVKPKSLTLMYTMHQCLYWIVVCCIVSFAATFLTEKGLDVATVGIVLFCANMLSFVVQLFLAGLADKAGDSRAIKTLMVVLSGMAFIIMLVFCLADLPLWLVAVLYVPMVAGFDMELPLMNSVVVFYSKRSYSISYGIARSVSAAAFGLASLGIGYAMKGFGSDVMLICAMVFTAAYIGVVFLYPKEKALACRNAASDEPVDTEALPIGKFIAKYKWYVISLMGVMLFGCSHLAAENYLIEVVRPLGGDSSTVGIALMIGTFVEIPVTLFVFRIYDKLHAHKVWMIIGISYTIRMLIYVLAGSIGMIYIGQLLQATSYALMPPTQINYARDCVDDRDMVKGQSTSTAMYSLGNALGNLLGGLAVSALGVSFMLKGCVAAAFLGFLFVAIFVPFALKAKNK